MRPPQAFDFDPDLDALPAERSELFGEFGDHDVGRVRAVIRPRSWVYWPAAGALRRPFWRFRTRLAPQLEG